MEISKKAFVGDMFINMAAAAIPVAVLNLAVYPLLAANIPTEDYGTLTTCVGLINFVNGIWGSSISFTRLLDKSEGLLKKNYTALLIASMVFAVAMNAVMLWITGCMMANISVLMLSACVVLIILNNYLIVEYRLILSYRKILLSNVFSSLGYAAGLGLLALTGYGRWEWVFLFGYGAAVVYNLLTTRIWKGPLAVDAALRPLARDTGVLVATSSISGASTYLDKLVIYPILGATAMAYYQTASIVAKIIPMFASAISNVILSYLVKIRAISKKTYWLYLLALGLCSALGILACDLVVPPVIRLLYPAFYESCVGIIPFANVIAILQMFYSFVFPLSLRYAKRDRQFLIQLGRLVPYLILAFALIRSRGLTGFCYATIISQLVQIAVVVLISLRSLGREEADGTA